MDQLFYEERDPFGAVDDELRQLGSEALGTQPVKGEVEHLI